MKIRPIAAISILLLMIICVVAEAGIPNMMTYTGMLSDKNGDVLEGEYTLIVKLYEASTGGVPVWTQTESEVDIDKGRFYLELTPDVSFDREYWLGFQIEGDSEMEPRQRLGSVPYAMNSKSSSLESVSIDSEGNDSLVTLTKNSSEVGEPVINIENNSKDSAIKIENGISYGGKGIEVLNKKYTSNPLIYAYNSDASGNYLMNNAMYLYSRGYMATAELRQYGPGHGLYVRKYGTSGEACKVSNSANGRGLFVYQSRFGQEALGINQLSRSHPAIKVEQSPYGDKPYVDIAEVFQIIKNDYVTDGVALKFGNRYLWIDGQDTLRVKRGMPIDDFDGGVVGQQ